MNHDYPHISDTEFPDLSSVNVYKFNNEYDFDKYTDNVKIKMLNVSWCGDYDNAVYFESVKERDKWFDEQEGLVHEVPTMFRKYNSDVLKIDLPFDQCMRYNYVMIDYGMLPEQLSPSGKQRTYYFINDIKQLSVNTTELNITVDFWQTYINDMDITYVNLLRGHAPMASTTVSKYLSNPIENSEYLLSADVNFGELQKVSSTENVVLNDKDIMLGFLSNGNLNDVWTNKIATKPYYVGESQALSAVDIYLIETKDYEAFRDSVTAQCPQFWLTVKGMFLIPRKLVRINDTFKFCGFDCHTCDTVGDKTITKFKLSKDKFGYADKISEIAKLYTFPYAAIEVNDFKGNTTLVKVEDTVGTLELHTIMCDMYPFLNIEAYMLGLGGNVKSSIKFVNNQDNTFNIGGRYYNFSTKWSIPVFSVQLTVETNWKLNHKIGADASKEVSYRSAQVARDNTALLVAKNSAVTSRSNLLLNVKNLNNNYVLDSNVGMSNDITKNTTNKDIEATNAQATNTSNAITTTAANSATASEVTAGISAVGNVLSSAVQGDVKGFAGSVISGVANVANSAVNAECAVTNAGVQAQTVLNSANITNGLTEFNAEQTILQNTYNLGTTKKANENNVDYEQSYNDDVNSLNNSYSTASTANSSNASEANADTMYNAGFDQNKYHNPPMLGQLTGTPDIISKPFGLSYNVVTQSKNAIRQTAEQFLRYGYMLNMQWKVNSFNMMPKFTYWQCDTVYCNDNGVYEGAQAMIKSILNGGVTVWKNPEEIGLVSVYENI